MTLVEVLMAITIAAIALAAMGNVIAAGSASSNKGELYNLAAQQASNTIINFETNDFDTNSSELGAQTTTYNNSTNPLAGLPNGVNMIVTQTISTYTDPNLLECDVTVKWTSSSKIDGAGQIEMTTLQSNT